MRARAPVWIVGVFFLFALPSGLFAANLATPAFVWSLDPAELVPTDPTELVPAAETDTTATIADSPKAKLAIIIDDLGYSYHRDMPFVDFPAALTLAFIPFTPHGSHLANAARDRGKEIMLHAPMETIGHHEWEPSLGVNMGRDELLTNLSEMLKSVPHVHGINNHGGSLLTQSSESMNWLMEELSLRRLYFVDSRTTSQSVAYATATSHNIAAAARDVFLDNSRDPQHIREQFDKMLQLALTEGKALAIGHPHQETLEVLAEEIPRLSRLGIELVPVSVYVNSEISEVDWMNRISASKD